MNIRLYTFLFTFLISSFSYAQHRCDGTYELLIGDDENCENIIEVAKKDVKYGNAAVLILTPKTKDKDILDLKDVMSVDTLASTLRLSSNMGEFSQGALWTNGGWFWLKSVEPHINQETITTCRGTSMKIRRKYHTTYMYIPDTKQTICEYRKIK